MREHEGEQTHTMGKKLYPLYQSPWTHSHRRETQPENNVNAEEETKVAVFIYQSSMCFNKALSVPAHVFYSVIYLLFIYLFFNFLGNPWLQIRNLNMEIYHNVKSLWNPPVRLFLCSCLLSLTWIRWIRCSTRLGCWHVV